MIHSVLENFIGKKQQLTRKSLPLWVAHKYQSYNLIISSICNKIHLRFVIMSDAISICPNIYGFDNVLKHGIFAAFFLCVAIASCVNRAQY